MREYFFSQRFYFIRHLHLIGATVHGELTDIFLRPWNLLNFNLPVAFSDAAGGEALSHGIIVVIYFPDFSRQDIYCTPSCQIQLQIFVTLKLNKFAAKKYTGWKTKRYTFRARAFCHVDKFSAQRSIYCTIYCIFRRKLNRKIWFAVKSSLPEWPHVILRKETANGATKPNPWTAEWIVHLFPSRKKRSPSRKQFNCRGRLIATGRN